MGDEAEHIGYDGGEYAEQDLAKENVRFVLSLSGAYSYSHTILRNL